jgi:hypothetical protein
MVTPFSGSQKALLGLNVSMPFFYLLPAVTLDCPFFTFEIHTDLVLQSDALPVLRDPLDKKGGGILYQLAMTIGIYFH